MSETSGSESVRPCPVCRQGMEHEREHGVEIDVCEGHGVWLDAGELEAIVLKLKARAGRQRRRAVDSARRRGKVSGAFWGWWSLLGE